MKPKSILIQLINTQFTEPLPTNIKPSHAIQRSQQGLYAYVIPGSPKAIATTKAIMINTAISRANESIARLQAQVTQLRALRDQQPVN